MILLFCCIVTAKAQEKRFTISGYVKEKGSEELLIGASIALPVLKTGTISNNYGFYSITLKEGNYELLVSYIGYASKAFSIKLDKNIEMD